jgi:hypothetical protein
MKIRKPLREIVAEVEQEYPSVVDWSAYQGATAEVERLDREIATLERRIAKPPRRAANGSPASAPSSPPSCAPTAPTSAAG